MQRKITVVEMNCAFNGKETNVNTKQQQQQKLVKFGILLLLLLWLLFVAAVAFISRLIFKNIYNSASVYLNVQVLL